MCAVEQSFSGVGGHRSLIAVKKRNFPQELSPPTLRGGQEPGANPPILALASCPHRRSEWRGLAGADLAPYPVVCPLQPLSGEGLSERWFCPVNGGYRVLADDTLLLKMSREQ